MRLAASLPLLSCAVLLVAVSTGCRSSASKGKEEVPSKGARSSAAPAPARKGARGTLATGFMHTCAVLDTGAVKCWGYNSSGRLGLGDSRDRQAAEELGDNLPPVDLGKGRTAVQVVANIGHTCALLDTGAVKCWGLNGWGELGQGDADARGDDPNEMGDVLPAIDLGAGRTAVQVAVGSSHTCALLDTGAVKCWGHNEHGQLGLGDANHRGDEPHELGDRLPAVDLGKGRTAVQVATGQYHSCVLLDTGAVRCWGANHHGQLGQGDTNSRGDGPGELGDSLPTVDLGTGRTAVQLSLGRDHTCALLDTGAVKCWGTNMHGELGLGDTRKRGKGPQEMGDALPTVDLGKGRTAVFLVAGEGGACARLDTGALKCWGGNDGGVLGRGDTNPRGDEPREMGDALPAIDLGQGRTAVQVTLSEHHACAQLDTGALKCWGSGKHGETGLGVNAQHGADPGQMGDALPTVDLGRGHTVQRPR